MGLDMHLVARYRDQVTDDEIQYWRKHVRLHAWMENLFENKGGRLEDFNCEELELSHEDLERLEKDLGANLLPVEARGYKTGTRDLFELADDLKSVAIAKAAVAAGAKIVYWPSW